MLLIEAGPRHSAGVCAGLSAYALTALERLGVEMRLGSAGERLPVQGGVTVGDQHVAADVILWAAGVRASPAAAWLGAPADKAGRVKVEPDLTVPGRIRKFS